MVNTAKKAREREIFDLVYGSRSLEEVIESERPDFLVRQSLHSALFGVEIAEFYHSETDARIKRNLNYGSDLLDGKDYMHKDDRRHLRVEKVDILTEDNEVRDRGVPAIIQPVPSPNECARMVAALVSQKSAKFPLPAEGLSHVNLVVRDTTDLLNGFSVDRFYYIYFISELRNAIAQSPFREVFFVTKMGDQVGFIPMKVLHLLSEAFLFGSVFTEHASEYEHITEAEEIKVFASYLGSCVSGEVSLRSDPAGAEVIHGDAGLLFGNDDSVAIRMYLDSPIPKDSQPATTEKPFALGESFRKSMSEFRKENTFTTSLWFPSGQNSA
jgi:hypothetical protein